MNMFKKKKTRDQKLRKAISMHRKLLLEDLKKEWDQAEYFVKRSEKYHRLVNHSKAVGSVVTKSILVLVVLGGVITVAAVAPNVFSAFGKIGKRRSFYNKKEFRKSINYLSSKKLIKVSRNYDSYGIEITEDGIEKALVISYKNLKVKKMKKWDGNWRMVIFDIPNKHKWARDCFRHKLREMDFYSIQKSIFVNPYPCYGEIMSLVSIFNISDYVKFVETEHLYSDSEVKEYFNL